MVDNDILINSLFEKSLKGELKIKDIEQHEIETALKDIEKMKGGKL